MHQEIYLKNGIKFWHCSMPDEFRIVIRYGKLVEQSKDKYEEVLEQEVIERFSNEDETSEYLSESIHIKMQKGYSDFDKSQIMQILVPKVSKNSEQYKIKVSQPQDDNNNNNGGDVLRQFQQQFPRPELDTNLSISQYTDQAVSQRSRFSSPTRSEGSVASTNDASTLGKVGHGPISVLLASTWQETVDPTNHFMSEKLDGMRMVWTGKTMYSRNGNLIKFPKFFVQGWPAAQLDGELWLERDSFQKLVSITKRNVPDEAQWQNVKYMVFDAPGLNAPFKVRYERFKEVIEKCDNQYLVCVPHILCTGMDHLREELTKVQGSKGEGLMLRDPEGRYEGKRSKVLLKVKTFDDDEATVLGHEKGEGRCAGMVGALRVRNSWGCEFSIGSGLTDVIRKNPPKIGSIITYKYWGTSKSNTPRFPIYLRERPTE